MASRRKQQSEPLSFDRRLVLNRYMLSLFGVDDFRRLAEELKDPDLEGVDADNVSYFYHKLISLPHVRKHWSPEVLRGYDENIVKHTREIQGYRPVPLRWKYFQYLALLFTEIYLDRYFRDRQTLLDQLNRFVVAFNQGLDQKSDRVPHYTEEDLRKLAFWNATGSGKTLLMHVHLKQYLHYLRLHRRERELNRIILLTPNEGLSRQHEEEFRLSGIPAELFKKEQSTLFQPGADVVQIIDIHKLKEEGKEKTVSVEAFEGNNLVLVDEGHRGASGVDWKSKRDLLCREGFSFEYSATFRQAVEASKKKQLADDYAKCILFNYSYKYFHEDGYGKDYSILNLKEELNERIKRRYLTAALLVFYQQLRLYHDRKEVLERFLLEKPLWVFVGSKVNAVRTENKRKVSDVVDILLFFADFVREPEESIRILDSLLSGSSDLLDEHKQDLFQNRFDYLIEREIRGEELYRDILRTLFHSDTPGARLHIDHLKGADGELGLRVGDGEYFGVVNVGDAGNLIKLCEENGLLTHDRDFSRSLFETLNEKESRIHVLIGSKRFTEGWNSWRVSTMGLMHIGKNEGSEIIQLFGRGVRLKGYGFSLKRSRALDNPPPDIPEHIELLETLNIFGVRADFMQRFREYLEEEGIPTDEDRIRIDVPVQPVLPSRRLYTLRLKPEANQFKKKGPKPTLGDVLPGVEVVVDWYPKLQSAESVRRHGDHTRLHEGKLTPTHLALIDLDAVYFEVERYKNERSWHNLNLPKSEMIRLLQEGDWYRLYIPKDHLQIDSLDKIPLWQEIAATLVRKYCERFYQLSKEAWQRPMMEYGELDHREIVRGFSAKEKKAVYRFTVEPENRALLSKLEQLKRALENGEPAVMDWSVFRHGGFEPFAFERHLYYPLIHIDKGTASVKVKPVHLNEGEREFVLDLKSYYDSNPDFFADKELYLLRNPSRGHGVGFFEAGSFYPDFILWVLTEERQYLAFVDPKGLRSLEGGLQNPKIQFYKKVKELEKRLGGETSSVILDSFIISVTEYEDLPSWGEKLSKEELEAHHVLFQRDDRGTYVKKMFEMMLDAEAAVV